MQAGHRGELEAALEAHELATVHRWCDMYGVSREAWHHVPAFKVVRDVAFMRTVAALIELGETREQARLRAALRLGLSHEAQAKRIERAKVHAIVGRAAAADAN